MPVSTQIKNSLNRVMAVANLQVGTLTCLRTEAARIAALAAAGYFEQPAFPLLPAFQSSFSEELLAELPQHRARFDSFLQSQDNEVGYTFANDYYRLA